MALLDELLQRREELRRLAARHGGSNLRVFGSVARREESPDSDVDFLVDLDTGRSLFDQAALLVDLEDALGRDVDVLTENGLKPAIRERVLADAVGL